MDIGLRIDMGKRLCSRVFVGMSFLFLFLTAVVRAQNDDFQATLDYKINKMKTELKLTYDQADAVRPIIKDYMVKRSAILEEVAGQGVVDHVAVKTTLKKLKENEYQKLSKILTEDQMKKWINKENLMASLNPDSTESAVDEGPSLTPSGADFKF